MVLVHGILETHWGNPMVGTWNPACLSFFNTAIDHKPIVTSSFPPYCVCHDLIFNTLSACALHCLKLVSGSEMLEKYAEKVIFDKLCGHVGQIFKTYATPVPISTLHDAHHTVITEQMHTFAACPPSNPPEPAPDPLADPIPHGDMIYKNACLFLHDVLVLCEFTNAIKGGYSSCIVCTLKILVLTYHGCGRTKYVHKLLHLVHNLTHIWPRPLQYGLTLLFHFPDLMSSNHDSAIMIKNWLINPTGKPNAWVPIDLLQEHMNFWVKVWSNPLLSS